MNPKLLKDHATPEQRINPRPAIDHSANLGTHHLLHPSNSPMRLTRKPTTTDLKLRWFLIKANGGY